MAKKVQGITIEIGGDTTGLQDALKDLNQDVKKTQDNLKWINKALELDPKNVELVAQKTKELDKAIKASEKKLEDLKAVQEAVAKEVQKGTEGAQEEYDKLTRQIVFANDELKKAKEAQEAFNKELEEIPPNPYANIGSEAESLAEKTKALSLASAALVGGLATAAVKTGQWADDLLTLSQQTGLATD